MPGSSGHKIILIFEEARAAKVSSDITEMIQSSIDQLDEQHIWTFSSSSKSSDCDNSYRSRIMPSSHDQQDEQISMLADEDDDDISSSDDLVEAIHSSPSNPVYESNSSAVHANSNVSKPKKELERSSPPAPYISEDVEIVWPADNASRSRHKYNR